MYSGLAVDGTLAKKSAKGKRQWVSAREHVELKTLSLEERISKLKEAENALRKERQDLEAEQRRIAYATYLQGIK